MARVALLIASFLASTAVAAQDSAGLPELKPLERFLGSWSYDGEDLTPGGGPVKCTSTRRWTGGGYFVESRRRCSTPRGDIEQLEVYGFDYSERVYRYWGFNGRFVSQYSAPTIGDGPIRWDNVAFRGRFRCSEAFDPGLQSSTSQCDSSSDGGVTWVKISGGRSLRTDR
jgi:hypothetical protein